MARLPYADLTKASPKVKEIFSRLEPLNIFRMIAHADSCFRGFVQLGSALLTRAELPPDLREIVILRVAASSGATYEWTQHTAIARRCGVPPAKIEAIRAGTIEASALTELEQAVLRFTDELIAGARVSDEAFALLHSRLSNRQLVELILTVGYYMMVARLLETTGVDLESGAGSRSILG